MGWRVHAAGTAVAAALLSQAGALLAQPAAPAPSQVPQVRSTKLPLLRSPDSQFSSACRVKEPAYDGRSPLRTVRRALNDKRSIRVVAVGSSSTAGVGASSPLASYPVRLENDLEGYVQGLQVEMITRGVSGEIAEDAAERMKTDIAELKPDLVVWQVGTNDALARVEEHDFADQLRETLGWLQSHKIDVVLIDPQYVPRLSKDAHYNGIVDTIATVAKERRVLLVRRFDAMADLALQHPTTSYLSGDRFHLNDLGYQCMAEYAARAIVAGIVQADIESQPNH